MHKLRERGSYLCEDCLSLVDINHSYYCLCDKPQKLSVSGQCPFCRNKHLDGLLSASSFDQKIIKEIVRKIKCCYVKELSLPCAFFILTHLQNMEQDISGYSLIPVPLSNAEKRRRGFNQSEEIAKAIAKRLAFPFGQMPCLR